MQREWLSILAGGAMLFTATGSAFAQGARGGTTTQAPAPQTENQPCQPNDQRPECAASLPAGAPAGAAAPVFSDATLIGIGAAALLAGILIAVTQSSGHTTTTTTH